MHEWAIKGIDDDERDAWIASGVRPTQAHCVRELIDGGLARESLVELVNGYSVLDRVLRGEGGAGIARMYRAERRRNQRKRLA